MVTKTNIINRALQSFGSRTTVTDAEVTAQSTNEAIQAQLVYDSTRDQLSRMAPWNFCLKTANLTYITSTPGTPENTSAQTTLWQPGQPPYPWAYEYQYPVDSLRDCWIIPATQTGFAGVPITTAVTGAAASSWNGQPVRFKVQNDQFYPVTAAAKVDAGSGYVANEIITLVQSPQGVAPVGAPAQVKVLTVDGAGAILTFELVNVIMDEDPAVGGSYFAPQANPVAQGFSTGVGVGATFNLTFGDQGPQRIILTNQEFATLTYVQRVLNINVMDKLFIDAWVQVLGAYINFGLAGDLKLSNNCVAKANAMIMEARKTDGNEGLTINNVTPDFIRIRGIDWDFDGYSSPYSSFDWGGMWPSF